MSPTNSEEILDWSEDMEMQAGGLNEDELPGPEAGAAMTEALAVRTTAESQHDEATGADTTAARTRSETWLEMMMRKKAEKKAKILLCEYCGHQHDVATCQFKTYFDAYGATII